MASNPYEITPADPLQTLQDWHQTLAQTAILESKARMQIPAEQRERMKLQADMQAQKDDVEFRKRAADMSPDMPLTERLSKLATFAFEAGRLGDGEKLTKSLSDVMNKESLAARRDADVALKQATEADKQLKTSIEVTPFMVASKDGFEIGNSMYQAATGQEHPAHKYARENNIPWSPEFAKTFDSAHKAQAKAIQEAVLAERERHNREMERQRVAQEKAREAEAAARIDAREKRQVAGAKAGAGKIATPKKFEVDGAFATLKELHPTADAKDLDEAAKELAADAKDMQLKDGGSYKDAVAKAVASNAGKWSNPKSSVPGLGNLPQSVQDVFKGKAKYTSSAAKAAGAKGAPKVGEVVKGYRYKGGDPGKQSSWESADDGAQE